LRKMIRPGPRSAGRGSMPCRMTGRKRSRRSSFRPAATCSAACRARSARLVSVWKPDAGMCGRVTAAQAGPPPLIPGHASNRAAHLPARR
jgi:hypothetical protein